MKLRLPTILVAAVVVGAVACMALDVRPWLGTVSPGAVMAAPTPASKCATAISSEGVRYLTRIASALAKCHESRLRGRLKEGEGCSLATGASLPKKVANAVTTARDKLTSAVCKACSPDDATCGTGVDDIDPASLGWPASCPGFEDASACLAPTSTLLGVAACEQCVSDAAIGQLLDVVYSEAPREPTCVRKAGTAIAAYLKRTAASIRQCRNRERSGKLPPGATCLPRDPNLDAKTAKGLANAESTKERAICSACGGRDKKCDGAGDVTVADYGFPAICPAVAQCAQNVNDLSAIARCADCVADFKSLCATAVFYQPSGIPTTCRAGACGDGVRNFGEACDPPDDLACPGACLSSCACPACGDGVVSPPGEQCEPSADGACPGQCRSDCTCPPPPTCGDGSVNAPSEECDPPADSVCPGRCASDCTCPLTLTRFQPMSGAAGAAVTLKGAAFGSVTGVAFNGVPATFTASSSFEIVATVPEAATTGPITVSSSTDSVTSSTVFAVLTRPDFDLTLDPPAANVIQGTSVSYAITLNSGNGFTQLAELSVTGLPSGVTVTLKPGQITAGQTAILTIQAPSGQPVGDSSFNVSAAAEVIGRTLSASATATLAVQPVTTSFIGRTVVADTMQTPLGGVTLTFLGLDDGGHPTGCSGQAVSDAAGNFAFTNLPPACLGRQLVRYDGTTATSQPGRYAGVDLVYEILPDQVVSAPALIHLPRIDDKETVWVQQNAPVDQTFAFESVPFLSVTVYAGTVFTLADGTQPDPFPLTAVQVPVDRLPDVKPPNPSMLMVFIVAFQPANANASQPVAVTFPNLIGTAPGTNMVLMTLDPTKGTMVPYGTGTVSNDGTQIVPDADPAHPGRRYGLVHFDWHGPMPPPMNQTNPSPDPCGPKTSNQVDLATGLEIVTSTDVAIAGPRGNLSLTRTYRTLSANPGPFGIGTNHNYGYQLNLVPVQRGQGLIGVIMPDGNELPLNLQPDGSFANSTIPALRGVVLTPTSPSSYRLRWKDGSAFDFQTLGLITALTSITDRNGNTTTLVRGQQPLQIVTITDPVGRELNLTYDGANRITSIVDPIGRVVAYAYDGQGRLSTVTDPEGGLTRYEYDGLSRLTEVTDPRAVVSTRYVYDTNGRVAQEIASDGGVTRFDYVLLNPTAPVVSPVLRTAVTDPLGNATTYHFNPQGFLVDVTDPLGQTRIFEREAGSNLLLAIRGVAKCAVCGGEAPGDRTFSYDPSGNVLSVTDALGNPTAFTYGATFNELVSITDALGRVTGFSYDDAGNLTSVTQPDGAVTSFAYDPHGLLTSMQDAQGNVVELAYDGLGNPSSVRDPLGTISAFSYDTASRLIATTDPRGKTRRFSYDRLDRTVAHFDAAGAMTQFAYDHASNLLSVTDALGHTTSYSYDSKGRIAIRTDPVGASESFGYDLNDNLILHVDQAGQLSNYAYDPLGRRIEANYADASVVFSYDARGHVVLASDSAGGQLVRAYDGLDRLISENSNAGAVSYAYDALGRRLSMTPSGEAPVNYRYGDNSELVNITQGTQSVDFQYDGLGRRVRLTLPSGVTTDYSYDAAGRIVDIAYRNTTGALGNLSYQYDAAGNRISVNGSAARPLLPAAVAGASYDAANRQLVFGSKFMTYDPNGKLVAMTDASDTTTYAWDGRERLVGVASSASTAAFTYDVLGRRTGKEIDGQHTEYLYDGSNIVREVAEGEPVSILRSLGIDEPLTRNSSEQYLTDALGNTVMLADLTGTVRVQYDYEPFGRTESTGFTSNAFQYTGRERDETGLYYYRARYYAPDLARFIEADPLRMVGGLNVYAYASNNPTNATDPFGLAPKRANVAGLARAVLDAVEQAETFFGPFDAAARIADEAAKETLSVRRRQEAAISCQEEALGQLLGFPPGTRVPLGNLGQLNLPIEGVRAANQLVGEQLEGAARGAAKQGAREIIESTVGNYVSDKIRGALDRAIGD